MEILLHVCPEGWKWMSINGIYAKKIVDFHVMIQLFVFAQKRQWHFPHDMQWRGGALIILKICTVYIHTYIWSSWWTFDGVLPSMDVWLCWTPITLLNVSLVRSSEVNSPCFQALKWINGRDRYQHGCNVSITGITRNRNGTCMNQDPPLSLILSSRNKLFEVHFIANRAVQILETLFIFDNCVIISNLFSFNFTRKFTRILEYIYSKLKKNPEYPSTPQKYYSSNEYEYE